MDSRNANGTGDGESSQDQIKGDRKYSRPSKANADQNNRPESGSGERRASLLANYDPPNANDAAPLRRGSKC
jgi:hypothetical protein